MAKRDSAPSHRRILGATAAIGASSFLLAGCLSIPGLGGGSSTVSYDGNDPSQIQAASLRFAGEGTFVETETTDPSATAWAGSGFFISGDGLAVTNNHVVSGAGTLTVEVGGDKTKDYTAQVVGASECYDLAVVKVTGLPGTVPYFGWHEGAINTGADISVIGFPLGTQDFSVTKGNIIKADIPFDTSWASLAHAMQVNIATKPGNSGGPAIDSTGKVVGVYYAHGDETDSSEQYAIGRDDAQPIIQQLLKGENPLSEGLNISAVNDPDNGIQGIWIGAVKAGGPADKAGFKAGDLLVDFGGVTMAKDGTVKDYCQVLKSQGDGATIDATVWRYSTGEILEGQINGKELAVTGSLSSGGNGGSEVIGGYTSAESDSGNLWINEVPDTWTDVSSEVLDNGSEILVAAPDQAAFNDFSGSGVQFIAYPYQSLSIDDAASSFTNIFADPSSGCTVADGLDGQPGGDDYYTGKVWTYACTLSGTKAAFVILAFDLNDGSGSGLIQASIFPGDSGDPSTTIENIGNSFGMRGF